MNAGNGDPQLAAEQRARVLIDRQVADAGWSVQDMKNLNLFASEGVACREVVMKAGHGRADYLLYVNRKVVGVIEAKPEGTTLSGVEWQSAMYATGLPAEAQLRAVTVEGRLPFVFEASGSETHFTNGYDPHPRSRRIFNFPQPQTLAKVVRDAEADSDHPTWRAKVRHLPELDTAPLRPAQITAITGVEKSLADQHFDRSLVQMATGAGKTFTAVTLAFRLLKFGGFRRILFLVDRNNLAEQTIGEFQNYRTPGDGRRFTEIYNVDKLTSAGMLGSSDVVVSTIQRVYSVLRGQEVTDQDDPNLDDFVPDAPVTVTYSGALPPEAFDLVIVDEAHRSIYGVWRGVLEYFDAHVIGLTATPGKQTFAFFRQNLVSEYTYPQSVADRVNVDFDLYRIRTQISEQGGNIEAGTIVPKVDRRTRQERLEAIEEDFEYTHKQLDRAVTAKSQIRLVLETFRDRLFTEIYPGRSTVPKTLIFAKDDAHAEEIVTTVREVFGKGNDFAAKITYAVRDPRGQLQAFRTSPTLRIAVTVDMIATGTDVKPLECVFFLRSVRSRTYFEQMKGRGVRVIDDTAFRDVTPGATSKERFVIVDAVGVTETELVDTSPLDRQPTVPLDRLLRQVSYGSRDPDTLSAIAARLARLDHRLTPTERAELETLAGGTSLKRIAGDLVRALDPDTQLDAARDISGGQEPTVEQITHATRTLLDAAIAPLAANPDLRQRLVELRRQHEQAIDETSSDTVIDAGYSKDATDRARSTVASWEAFCAEHRDEITALQILYNQRQPARLTFREIKQLAQTIARPPYQWTPETLWHAYEQLDRSRVRGSGGRVLTDLVSLVRIALHHDDQLVPYPDLVHERYHAWLLQQQNTGRTFTPEQLAWLDRIRDHIAAALAITTDDFAYTPFVENGGLGRATQVFGDGLGPLLDELNEVLAA